MNHGRVTFKDKTRVLKDVGELFFFCFPVTEKRVEMYTSPSSLSSETKCCSPYIKRISGAGASKWKARYILKYITRVQYDHNTAFRLYDALCKELLFFSSQDEIAV